MIKAVLFDLDDTLLGNANATFVPEYSAAGRCLLPAKTLANQINISQGD